VTTTKEISTQRAELLAPAGSLASFFAALEAGCDAVFCGLDLFSARARAKNFSLTEMAQLCAYAHAHGRKLYVTLNTLIKEGEIDQLINILTKLAAMAVDGIIIQDLGLSLLARDCFPDLPLHGSTQMVIHNRAGARFLERFGFQRVVLARELTLAEIAAVAGDTAMEIEHFIHGALCYSISGHCLFSSYLDGRSGNRGRCVQPCRRRYNLQGRPGYFFSTSDFSAVAELPTLLAAGVKSLKIEGRMKGAEYVAAAVAAYRKVLDAPANQQKQVIAEATQDLEQAMGRQACSGFLSDSQGKGVILSKHTGGIGHILGRIDRAQGKAIVFRTAEPLFVGDRLRIQPDSDRPGHGFVVRELMVGTKQKKRAEPGNMVTIPLPYAIQVSPGDMVFKLSTGKTFTLSEEACRKKLSASPPAAEEVELTISCQDNELLVQATAKRLSLQRKYDVEMIAASHSPLSQVTLAKIFCATGQPDLTVKKLIANDLPPVVIKPSRLKEIRRDFFSLLGLQLAQARQTSTAERLAQARAWRDERACLPQDLPPSPLLLATDQAADLAVLAEEPETTLVLPLTRELLIASTDADRNRLIWDLPSIIFDRQWQEMSELTGDAMAHGFTRFRLNNISHLELFRDRSGLSLMAGPWLYCLNSLAMACLQSYRLRHFFLPLENDRANLAALLASPWQANLIITVYSPLQLFTSRVTSADLGPAEIELRNEHNDSFRVSREKELTITHAQTPLSLLGRVNELRAMGAKSLLVDCRGIGIRSPAGQGILKAYSCGYDPPGSTAFNFERGLA
jgi:putative protease